MNGYTHLTTLIYENELYDVICVLRGGGDFSRYPAEFLVGEPDLGTLAVDVFRHSGEVERKS